MKLGGRLRGALRAQTLDGQVLDCVADPDSPEAEGVENVDILKYLDSIAAEDAMGEQDLSNYKVVLTNVETRVVSDVRCRPHDLLGMC